MSNACLTPVEAQGTGAGQFRSKVRPKMVEDARALWGPMLMDKMVRLCDGEQSINGFSGAKARRSMGIFVYI